MGGIGSGRQGRTLLVESGFKLDLNRLLKQRNIVCGQHRFGVLTWNNTQTGEQVASIRYEACLVDRDFAWAQLRYNVNGMPKDYRVRLVVSPCHYGGIRWWWVCPISGRRASKLYLLPGADTFAARAVYRPAYQSQRETALDRTHARQARIHRKLGSTYNGYEQTPPPRPKRMHRKTFERLEAELDDAMHAHNVNFELGATKFLVRFQKAGARRR